MPDTDPFADTAFVTRLQKLLAMLSSEQPGEADAARRKLLEHLASQRLSLTEVAQRLGQGAPQGASRPSFTQGAQDMSLERQLHLARMARQEVEADAHRALVRIAELQRMVQESSVEIARLASGRARLRLVASFGWITVAVVASLAAANQLHTGGLVQGQAMVASEGRLLHPGSNPASDAILRPLPGEQFGTVLVQDLAVRLTPNEEANVRAFLNRGMRVVVEQQLRIGPQSWLLIRSVTGSGWVRGSDVLH